MVTRNFRTTMLIWFVPLLSMDSLSKGLSLLPVIFILCYVTESMSVVYLTSTSCPWYTLLQHIRFQKSWLRHLSLVITFCFPSPFTSTPMTPPFFLNLSDFSTSSSYYHHFALSILSFIQQDSTVHIYKCSHTSSSLLSLLQSLLNTTFHIFHYCSQVAADHGWGKKKRTHNAAGCKLMAITLERFSTCLGILHFSSQCMLFS